MARPPTRAPVVVRQMDPDELLKQLTSAVRNSKDEKVRDMFRELNTWLETGGFVPARWGSRELWIAVYRRNFHTSDESIHPTKTAAYKKICEHIYGDRHLFRGTQSIDVVLRLMGQGKWQEAAEHWATATAGHLKYAVSRAPVETESQIRFKVDPSSVKPYPPE